MGPPRYAPAPGRRRNLVRRGFWFFFRFCRILPGRRPALRSPSSPGGGRARERVPESVLQRKSPSAHLKLKQSTCSALHCLLAKLRVWGQRDNNYEHTVSNSKLNRSCAQKVLPHDCVLRTWRTMCSFNHICPFWFRILVPEWGHVWLQACETQMSK